MKKYTLFKVGKYIKKYNERTGLNLPLLDIYQSSGLIVHIQSHHPNCVQYLNSIALILTAPDYIGVYPKEVDSIELIKILEDNIKVAIKLDRKKNHYYIASIYDISSGKIKRHLNSGRLKPY